MSTGIVKNTSIVSVVTEVTEGTAVASSSATDGYIQPLEDGFALNPTKELVERDVLSSSIGDVTPRTGLKSASVTLPVELKASGTEGVEPDTDNLYKGALGNRRQVAVNRTVTGAGSTTTVFDLSAGHAASFSVGDIIVVKETASHSVHAITAVNIGTDQITVTPARSAPPTAATQISKTTVYYPANSGHPSMTANFYWANTIREYAAGCKVTSLAIDGFETGGLAKANFELQGLSFTQVDGAAPHTPTYDTGIPPIILSSCVYIDGTQVDINALSINLSNDIGKITSTCSAVGTISQRVIDRTITGTLNPYKDDTSVANWTKFNNNTEFSLFAYTLIPSSTSGEFTMGSVVGFYMPKCIITELQVADQEGILVDQIGFRACRGSDGATDEFFIGFI